jgi:hypothetical protein
MLRVMLHPQSFPRAGTLRFALQRAQRLPRAAHPHRGPPSPPHRLHRRRRRLGADTPSQWQWICTLSGRSRAGFSLIESPSHRTADCRFRPNRQIAVALGRAGPPLPIVPSFVRRAPLPTLAPRALRAAASGYNAAEPRRRAGSHAIDLAGRAPPGHVAPGGGGKGLACMRGIMCGKFVPIIYNRQTLHGIYLQQFYVRK